MKSESGKKNAYILLFFVLICLAYLALQDKNTTTTTTSTFGKTTPDQYDIEVRGNWDPKNKAHNTAITSFASNLTKIKGLPRAIDVNLTNDTTVPAFADNGAVYVYSLEAGAPKDVFPVIVAAPSGDYVSKVVTYLIISSQSQDILLPWNFYQKRALTPKSTDGLSATFIQKAVVSRNAPFEVYLTLAVYNANLLFEWTNAAAVPTRMQKTDYYPNDKYNMPFLQTKVWASGFSSVSEPGTAEIKVSVSGAPPPKDPVGFDLSSRKVLYLGDDVDTRLKPRSVAGINTGNVTIAAQNLDYAVKQFYFTNFPTPVTPRSSPMPSDFPNVEFIYLAPYQDGTTDTNVLNQQVRGAGVWVIDVFAQGGKQSLTPGTFGQFLAANGYVDPMNPGNNWAGGMNDSYKVKAVALPFANPGFIQWFPNGVTDPFTGAVVDASKRFDSTQFATGPNYTMLADKTAINIVTLNEEPAKMTPKYKPIDTTQFGNVPIGDDSVIVAWTNNTWATDPSDGVKKWMPLNTPTQFEAVNVRYPSGELIGRYGATKPPTMDGWADPMARLIVRVNGNETIYKLPKLQYQARYWQEILRRHNLIYPDDPIMGKLVTPEPLPLITSPSDIPTDASGQYMKSIIGNTIVNNNYTPIKFADPTTKKYPAYDSLHSNLCPSTRIVVSPTGLQFCADSTISATDPRRMFLQNKDTKVTPYGGISNDPGTAGGTNLKQCLRWRNLQGDEEAIPGCPQSVDINELIHWNTSLDNDRKSGTPKTDSQRSCVVVSVNNVTIRDPSTLVEVAQTPVYKAGDVIKFDEASRLDPSQIFGVWYKPINLYGPDASLRAKFQTDAMLASPVVTGGPNGSAPDTVRLVANLYSRVAGYVGNVTGDYSFQNHTLTVASVNYDAGAVGRSNVDASWTVMCDFNNSSSRLGEITGDMNKLIEQDVPLDYSIKSIDLRNSRLKRMITGIRTGAYTGNFRVVRYKKGTQIIYDDLQCKFASTSSPDVFNVVSVAASQENFRMRDVDLISFDLLNVNTPSPFSSDRLFTLPVRNDATNAIRPYQITNPTFTTEKYRPVTKDCIFYCLRLNAYPMSPRDGDFGNSLSLYTRANVPTNAVLKRISTAVNEPLCIRTETPEYFGRLFASSEGSIPVPRIVDLTWTFQNVLPGKHPRGNADPTQTNILYFTGWTNRVAENGYALSNFPSNPGYPDARLFSADVCGKSSGTRPTPITYYPGDLSFVGRYTLDMSKDDVQAASDLANDPNISQDVIRVDMYPNYQTTMPTC